MSMNKKWKKRDAGTIFNPVMYLMVLILTVQLMLLFVEYRRVAWVSNAVTDSMTDALLGAATLNEDELYHYGATDHLEILYPKEKYDLFKEILQEELELSADMHVTDQSLALLAEQVEISDFGIFSICGDDITYYDFDATGGYVTTSLEDMAGIYDPGNGEVIESTTFVAEIEFTVKFFGVPVEVNKYHMVDVTR